MQLLHEWVSQTKKVQVNFFLFVRPKIKDVQSITFLMQSISYTIHEPTGIFAIIITKAIGIKGNKGWM